MGSTDKAVITGFICRLCSKMNRFVIHIYGEEGERLKLAEKIRTCLPITVKMNDPLPKTVCLHCIERLERQLELLKKIKIARDRSRMESDINNQVPASPLSSTIVVDTTTTTTAAAVATISSSTTTIGVDTQIQSIHSQSSLSPDALPSTGRSPC
ncbi:hypothetical protein PV325_012028 [Microctonus aethiopoides]|uniref:ZAD domain-containing protein n=1 Tax=Microctonus aethiopoides TaxID=144406 RepID=A0AA39KJI2_9HYME|nr:hypothetical protein PV325_012028 [Microctonus aethiopoides]KAK0163764.1 hypothetical protein PV328_002460 [Microctonus aethiopoides]